MGQIQTVWVWVLLLHTKINQDLKERKIVILTFEKKEKKNSPRLEWCKDIYPATLWWSPSNL